MSNIWLNYGGKGLKFGSGIKVSMPGAFPPIAQKTIRFDFKYDHFNPLTDLRDLSEYGFIWTHVRDDIYDFHYDSTDWGERTVPSGLGGLFNMYEYMGGSSYVYPMSQHQFDVLDMDMTGVTTVSRLFNSARQVQNIFSIRNTSSVTNFSYFIAHNSRIFNIPSIPLFDTSSAIDMSNMFRNCTYLSSVPLFNTENVTNMSNMLYGCRAITSVPLFNTSKVTNVAQMFNDCIKVESGALALYTQMSSQATPPSIYNGCFTNCGSNTTTGAAELAQIPTSWGGTMA